MASPPRAATVEEMAAASPYLADWEAYRSGPSLHLRHKPCGQHYPYAATSTSPVGLCVLNVAALEHECPVQS